MILKHQALLFLAIIIFCFTLAPFTGLVDLGPSYSSTLLHKENIIPQLPMNGMLPIQSSSTKHVPTGDLVTTNKDRFKTLGIASDIFVLSLPRRTDRHKEMEVLRVALDLQWTFVDAVESHTAVIESIMAQMRSLRAAKASTSTDRGIFRWPQNIDALSSSSQPLGLEGSDLWASQSSSTYNNKRHLKAATVRGIAGIMNKSTEIPTTSAEPLTCTSEDYSVLPFTRGLPEYKLLTMAKMACWNSHLSVIRRIAESSSKTRVALEQDVSLILEDDIDMEYDIRERLAGIWTSIPAGWDMVFLGHCWSNESHYPALYPKDETGTSPSPALPPANTSRLHPSFAPKCTHAYALSRSGARRLLLHLRYPPFAYSRALDQAFAWLVQSGRIRAYSVVPSVIVQRKVGGSDVMYGQDGMGSGWREELVRGVFGT